MKKISPFWIWLWFVVGAAMILVSGCAYVRESASPSQLNQTVNQDLQARLITAQQTIDGLRGDLAASQDRISRLVAENVFLEGKLAELQRAGIEYEIEINPAEIPLEGSEEGSQSETKEEDKR